MLFDSNISDTCLINKVAVKVYLNSSGDDFNLIPKLYFILCILAIKPWIQLKVPLPSNICFSYVYAPGKET